MSRKAKIALSILIVIIVGFLAWGTFRLWRSPNGDSKFQRTSESSFLLNEFFYDCSRPIDGKWVKTRVDRPGGTGYDFYFHPSDQEDFRKYCRTGAVIEYKSVIDILRRNDVNQVIEKYDTTEAWVRALPHVYINDKDYLKRILPAYKNVKIDCIIVVHSPEGTRFFIENGEVHNSHADHEYLEVPAAEFLESLNKASHEDITNFWLGLH